jgi:hypothetical protein
VKGAEMNHALATCVLGTCLLFSAIAWSEVPRVESNPTKVILATALSRESLVSGIFAAEGQFTSKRGQPIGRVRKWQISSAFDMRHDCLRYDDALDLKVDGNVVTLHQRFFRTKDRFAYWSDLGSPKGAQLIIYPSNAKLPDLLTFIDVRAVGIGFMEPFRERQSLDTARTALQSRPMSVAMVNKEGLVRMDLRWRPEGTTDECYRATWVSTKEGYTIRKVDQFIKPYPNDLKTNPRDWGEPALSAQFSWKDIRGVWCPQSVRIDNSATVLDLAFTWKSVNEDVPLHLYSEADLKLPELTPVYDSRFDPAIALGTIADVLKGLPPTGLRKR